MSRKAAIWIIGIIAASFILLRLEYCSYAQLGKSLSMEGVTKKITSKFKKTDHIQTSDLAQWLNQPDKKKSTLLIDSRTPAEFQISHLPDAKNLQTVEEVKQHLAGLPKPPERIVLYCSVGYRSAELASELEEADLKEITVHNLLGSIFAWVNEGRLIVKGDKTPTSKVHPFNATWGRLLKPEHRAEIPGSK